MAQSILNQPQFQDADKAREYLEAQVWPNGRVCPHCGVIGEHYVLKGKSNRPGLYKCADCREPFTVTVGTVFERSKVGLHIWLQAVHMMSASKKGVSAKQLERMLGVTYKTAWFMCHRIREAMKSGNATMLGGPGSSDVVEADETFWGAQADEEGIRCPKGIKRGFADKMKIVTLVEREGNKRSFHVANVSSPATPLGVALEKLTGFKSGDSGSEFCPQCWPQSKRLRSEPYHNAAGVWSLVCDACGFYLVT